MLLEDASGNVSSAVAAGIMNPITGKRTVLTWRAEEIFKEGAEFYTDMERRLESAFFQRLPIFKIFETVFEQNTWLSRHADAVFKPFMEKEIVYLDKAKVENPFGSIKVLQSARLNINEYLLSLHKFLVEKKALQYQFVDLSKIERLKGYFKYGDIEAKQLIFCDGTHSMDNPFFNNLPHKPVHGEILEVELKNFYSDRIINKGIYILPIGSDKYLIGSTYNWDMKDAKLTNEGKSELLKKFEELVKLPYKLVGHYAGVRPATNDRRPFLGAHFQIENMFIFGGFGSKGVSLIPYLSKLMLDFLNGRAELPREVNISRVQ